MYMVYEPSLHIITFRNCENKKGASCGRNNGMEMMSIFDNLLDDMSASSKYMHLVPTPKPETNEETEVMIDDFFQDSDTDSLIPSLMGLFDSMTDKVKGCHKKMKQMVPMWMTMETDEDGDDTEDTVDTYFYYDDTDEFVDERPDYIYVNADRELVDESNNSSLTQHMNDNLLLLVMGVIMIAIMICGVCYVGRRYLMDKKERNRMDHYVQMEENDGF